MEKSADLRIVICFGLSAGEYGFEIYANEPEDGRAFTHVCQYLVHYEAPPNWAPSIPDWGQGEVTTEAVRGSAPGPRVVSTAELTLQPAFYRNSPQRESLIRLRQMPAYGDEAPSIGQLPQPYLEPQIASVRVS